MCEISVSETEHIITILGKKIKKQTKPRFIIAYCPTKICKPKKHCAKPQSLTGLKRQKKIEFTEDKAVIRVVIE